MKYSIGVVSRLLGVTTSALHFYEKEGVIDLPKEESGWRFYSEADVYRLISAKKYRSMNVSLREIAMQFSEEGMNGEQVIARMKQKKEDALRLSAQYAALARDIGSLIQASEYGMASVNVVDIRPAEEMLVLRTDNGSLVPEDKAQLRLVEKWLKAMPAVSVGFYRAEGEENATFAYLISADRAAEYGLEADGKRIRRLPAGMALHAVVACGDALYGDHNLIFDPVCAFAQEHRFEQTGAMYGSTLFVDCSNGGKMHYYDTYMMLP